MLNGIGGRTIAEAMANTSAREVQLWQAFEAKHGSLNWMARQDWNASLLASMFANSKRRVGSTPFKQSDFMRWSSSAPIGLQEAVANWS